MWDLDTRCDHSTQKTLQYELSGLVKLIPRIECILLMEVILIPDLILSMMGRIGYMTEEDLMDTSRCIFVAKICTTETSTIVAQARVRMIYEPAEYDVSIRRMESGHIKNVRSKYLLIELVELMWIVKRKNT